jgi:hypothetical protein
MKTVEFKRYSQKECDYHCTCDLYEEEHPDHSGTYVLASEAVERERVLEKEVTKWKTLFNGISDDLERILNPCGHTGFESSPCAICGYPDPRKYIADLRERERMSNEAIADWHKVADIRSAEIIDLQSKLGTLMAEFVTVREALEAKLTAASERSRVLVEAADFKRNAIITDAEDFKQHLHGKWVAVPEEDFNKLRAALAQVKGGG